MNRPIGVLGGTFDPVHNGHLQIARFVRDRLDCHPILLIVSARPPLRRRPVADAAHRFAMVGLAAADQPGLVADDMELERRGPSYTVWTLRAIRARVGDRPIYLIVGADAFLGLASWYHWPELLTLAHLVVLPRPGWVVPKSLHPATSWVQRDPAAVRDRAAGRVVLCEAPPMDISASRIRERIGQGADVSGQMPAAVWNYICRHGLYRYREH